MYPPPGRYTNLLRGRPKLTAMASSTRSITAPSTRPIRSRRRRLCRSAPWTNAVPPAHPLPQAAFVQGADLLQQDHGILGQTAALGRHLDVGGQLGLAHLGGDGRRDDGGAVAVAGVVLHDQHRAHAPLLAAYHRAQVGIINFAALDIRIHKRSHSAGRSTRKKRVTFILPRSPGIYTRFSRPASFYGAAGGGVRQNRSSSSRSVTCPFCKYTRGTRLLTAQVSS